MGGGGGGGGGGADANGYDAHHKVMQLLTPQPRGCDASNGTTVGLSTAARAAPAYCGTKLPKRHQCVCLSFTEGLEFGSALAEAGCKVFSFDPFGGRARTVSSNLAFIPADISTFDGLVKAGNDTVAALTLNSIISSQQLDRVDILRMTIASARQWKTLKYLVNSGSLDGVLQLSLNMSFCDITMWSEYQVCCCIISTVAIVLNHLLFCSTDYSDIGEQSWLQAILCREAAHSRVPASARGFLFTLLQIRG